MTLRSERPVVRIDNALLWPDGYCRKMTMLERYQWRYTERRLFPRDA